MPTVSQNFDRSCLLTFFVRIGRSVGRSVSYLITQPLQHADQSPQLLSDEGLPWPKILHVGF